MKEYIRPVSCHLNFDCKESVAQFIVTSQSVSEGEAREMELDTEEGSFSSAWEEGSEQ